ncbi:MAG: C39 family peptidase, partial [Bacteroidota bacterium]
MKKESKADVLPVRQQSQYTCMATSLMMCLQAIGIDVSEKEVADVMGCRPMRGASWEDAIMGAQHFGARASLVS